jgi:hypothetical protein
MCQFAIFILGVFTMILVLTLAFTHIDAAPMANAPPSQSEASSTPLLDDRDRPTEPPATPKTSELMLATFADLYRQEIAAEEDVYRTLPFFGTALGVGVAALVYATGRLPELPKLTTHPSIAAFIVAALLLGLSVVEATLVLVWVSRAMARHPYRRIGSEPNLRTRLSELQAYYEAQGTAAEDRDRELVNDMRQALLDSYAAVTPTNRALNQRRYRFRALAASSLVRSLIWALGATTVIAITDKLGYLPR